MQTLTKDTIVEPNKRADIPTLAFQYNHNGTNMSLYGSVDGDTFILIETFAASTLKQISFVNYFALSDLTDATRTRAQITGNTSANNGQGMIDHA